MVNYRKGLFLASAFIITILTTMHLSAQNANVPPLRDESGFMRSEGKIYVVMVVVVTILAGLILYISRLDKKLSKLEKGDNR